MASKQAQHQIQMESWRLARDRIIIRVGVSGHENLLVVGFMLALYPKSGRAVFSFLVKKLLFFGYALVASTQQLPHAQRRECFVRIHSRVNVGQIYNASLADLIFPGCLAFVSSARRL